jgi:hypothetical protein
MQTIQHRQAEKIDAATSSPVISMLLPFEPHMVSKQVVVDRIKEMVRIVGNELKDKYGTCTTEAILSRFKKTVSGLNYNNLKKSVAIYISPVADRVIYLDIAVKETIRVKGNFDIRDIIWAKTDTRRFLLLKLDRHDTQIFLSEESSLSTLNKDVLRDMAKVERDLPEKVGNFSDNSNIKEIRLHQFLRTADLVLQQLLKDYPLPVFVMGSSRLTGHFMQLTRNAKNIVRIIKGDYPATGNADLLRILKPYFAEWKAVKYDNIIHQIENAAGSHKLATGIRDVWNQVNRHNARLLIMEEDFSPPVILPAVSNAKRHPDGVTPKTAVDQMIATVLESGGDVELVGSGMLKDHHHIALIERYAVEN